jgi:hypothetical protein
MPDPWEADMPDLYVCGHGGWDAFGAGIFAKLPRGTEVILYKEIGQFLLVTEAEAILSRSPGALAPERVIDSHKNCPDLTLYPAEEFWSQFGTAANRGGVDWLAVASPTRLSELFQRWAGARIHWIACSGRYMR